MAKANPKPQDNSKYILKDCDVYVGLDMSLNSPGICMIDGKAIYLYFFPQRKRQVDWANSHDNFKVQALDIYQEDFTCREQRYDEISEMIVNLMPKDRKVGVGIEAYAYGAKGRATTGLAEMGAIIRNKLYKRGIPYTEISPTTVKKFATGTGRANKYLMCYNYQASTGINLYDFFNMKESFKIEPPSPISDVVDAYFICKMVRGDTVPHHDAVSDLLKRLRSKVNVSTPK